MARTSLAHTVLEGLLASGKISLDDITPLVADTQTTRQFLYSLGAYGEQIPRDWLRLLGVKRCKQLQLAGVDMVSMVPSSKEVRLEVYKKLWPLATSFLLNLPSTNTMQERLKPKVLDDLEMILKFSGTPDDLTIKKAYTTDFS